MFHTVKTIRLLFTVSGEFLDCEGSGLYSLQSSCKSDCCYFRYLYVITLYYITLEKFTLPSLQIYSTTLHYNVSMCDKKREKVD